EGKDVFNNTSSAPIHIHYSNLAEAEIGGYWMGDHNFPYNPSFIDDSCHIADSSICWEAGVSSIIIGGNTYQCPDHDIDGQYRPLNNAADVGVDEILIDRISEHGIAKNKYALHVYPNPSGGRITLEYTYPGFQEISVSILDIGGRVYQVQLPEKFGITETKMDLNLSHLPDGVYLLRLQAGDVVETAKIIIRK
ncbi:MAG TPA: T9SS type A sorting domain-containing protein, partial [Bacteroidales bacterium]|nr:T9SS type A sorting domain-containing protein [Bacteroidales bacterium]